MSDLADPMSADDVKAREWLEAGIWHDGPICPAHGVVNGFTLMRCRLYRTSRRRSSRNAVAPTPLRPSIAQWWSRSPGCRRAVHAALADFDQTREAIYEAVRVAAVSRAKTDEGATAKAIGGEFANHHSITALANMFAANIPTGRWPPFDLQARLQSLACRKGARTVIKLDFIQAREFHDLVCLARGFCFGIIYPCFFVFHSDDGAAFHNSRRHSLFRPHRNHRLDRSQNDRSYVRWSGATPISGALACMAARLTLSLRPRPSDRARGEPVSMTIAPVEIECYRAPCSAEAERSARPRRQPAGGAQCGNSGTDGRDDLRAARRFARASG
jgi:hypothetical protein